MKIDTDRVQKIIDEHTYVELMEMAGVSRSTATKWKSGHLDWRKSSFEMIQKLVIAERERRK